MLRYLKTLFEFWHTSIAAEMEYRANFFVASLTSVMMLGVSLFSLGVLYRTGYEMGNWTYAQALIVVGLFTILSGVQQMCFHPNRRQITEMVREGTLDFVLLKPIDSQFWLSTRSISIWGLPDVLLGLGLVIYAGSFAPGSPQLGIITYAWGLLPLLLGLLTLYALGYILSTLTIWFVKLFNITMAMDALLEAGRYPIPAYPAIYQVFFTFVIPVAFMTTMPATVMLGKTDATWWLVGGVVLPIAFFVASRWFWKFALRYYTSASS